MKTPPLNTQTWVTYYYPTPLDFTPAILIKNGDKISLILVDSKTGNTIATIFEANVDTINVQGLGSSQLEFSVDGKKHDINFAYTTSLAELYEKAGIEDAKSALSRNNLDDWQDILTQLNPSFRSPAVAYRKSVRLAWVLLLVPVVFIVLIALAGIIVRALSHR